MDSQHGISAGRADWLDDITPWTAAAGQRYRFAQFDIIPRVRVYLTIRHTNGLDGLTGQCDGCEPWSYQQIKHVFHGTFGVDRWW